MANPFFFAVAGVIRGTFYFEPLRCGPQIIGNRLNIPGRGADLVWPSILWMVGRLALCSSAMREAT